MYYLFLLMLNSKKLISLSLASALVLSLPLNSLAIGVNDTSNYVTSADYNTKIAELETRIADLEANQPTTDVNTALKNYFTDESTSPIVAGDYITITNDGGKKKITATSKPTIVTSDNMNTTVTKKETDDDITYTIKSKTLLAGNGLVKSENSDSVMYSLQDNLIESGSDELTVTKTLTSGAYTYSISPKYTTSIDAITPTAHSNLTAKGWKVETGWNSYLLQYGKLKVLSLSAKVSGSAITGIKSLKCMTLPSQARLIGQQEFSVCARINSNAYEAVCGYANTAGDVIEVEGLNQSQSYISFYFCGCFACR